MGFSAPGADGASTYVELEVVLVDLDPSSECSTVDEGASFESTVVGPEAVVSSTAAVDGSTLSSSFSPAATVSVVPEAEVFFVVGKLIFFLSSKFKETFLDPEVTRLLGGLCFPATSSLS